MDGRVRYTSIVHPNRPTNLGVGHEEGGDPAAVQLREQLVDEGVHDGLAHQAQGAVRDGQGLFPPVEDGRWMDGERRECVWWW